MPLVNYNTKADFDAAYDLGAEGDTGRPAGRPEIRLGYSRAVLWDAHVARAAKLVELFNWPTTTKILIVGAGYAWTAEALETNHGYTNIVTTDTSGYIQTTQDTDETADLDAAITAVGLDPASGEGLAKRGHLIGKGGGSGNRRRHSRPVENEDLSNNGSRNRIRQILGDIEVGISEELISTLSDAEVLDASDRIDKINAGITRIHLTTELQPGKTQDPAYNWKTLSDWKLLLPGDTFVSLNTWQVL
jgi:hypothetical protein